MQSTVKETLLGWHGSFVGRKQKKVWRVAHLCLFWTIWKERNRRSFENVELSIQRLKYLFLCNLLSWTKLFIGERLTSIVDFIDWLGLVWGKELFFVSSSFFLALFGYRCIHCVYFGAPFLVFNTNLIYWSKKKSYVSTFMLDVWLLLTFVVLSLGCLDAFILNIILLAIHLFWHIHSAKIGFFVVRKLDFFFFSLNLWFKT